MPTAISECCVEWSGWILRSRHHPASLRFHPLRSTQEKNGQPHFRSFLYIVPFYCPHQTDFTGGRTRCPLKITPAGSPASRSFWLKGDRPKRTARHKKKTMKTKSHNSRSGLQSQSEQLNIEKRLRINFARRRANRCLATGRLLALLRREAPRFFELAEVVGKWVWIQFSQKQPREVTRVLAELGFHWNSTRQTWQHPCGVNCSFALPVNPRRKYRSYFPSDLQPL